MDTINIIIGIIFLVFWVLAGVSFVRSINKDPFPERPEIQFVSSLGVLGTFLGITIGLLAFNSNDLQNSIPGLLNGMRTAFLTSILGMSSSLLMKYKQRKKRESSNKNSGFIENVTLEDILNHLTKSHESQEIYAKSTLDLMVSNNNMLQNTIQDSLTKMTNSLVGDGESTLVGQLKFFRSDMNDSQKSLRDDIKNGNNALITEFHLFAKQMSENNAKAFIEALNETMKDFNSKLQEQFGENFKQLNVAVGKLLEWQEQYKNTVIETTENQKLIFAGIEQAKQSLAEMASTSSSVKSSAEQLSDIIVTAAIYQKTLETTLLNLNSIAEQAKNLIPSINELHRTTCENIMSEGKQAIKTSTELNQCIHDEISATQTTINETNKTLMNSFNTAMGELNELAENHQIAVKESLNACLEGIENIYSNTNSALRDSSELVSQSITHELNKATDASITINKLIEKNSKEVLDENNKALSSLSSYSHAAIEQVNQHALKTSSAIEGFANLNIDTINKEIEAIQKASKNLESNALEITKRVSDYIVELVKKYNENIESTTDHINKNLEEELTKSLNSLGRALATLSEKFTKDYTPLTEKLQRVVEISKKIN